MGKTGWRHEGRCDTDLRKRGNAPALMPMAQLEAESPHAEMNLDVVVVRHLQRQSRIEARVQKPGSGISIHCKTDLLATEFAGKEGAVLPLVRCPPFPSSDGRAARNAPERGAQPSLWRSDRPQSQLHNDSKSNCIMPGSSLTLSQQGISDFGQRAGKMTELRRWALC